MTTPKKPPASPGDNTQTDTHIAQVEQHFTPPLIIQDDLRPLRQAFADLSDALLLKLCEMGLDLDDCILERFATLAADSSNAEQTLKVDSLADAQSFRNSLPNKELHPIITGVAVRAVRAPDYPSRPPITR